ncbi:histidine kinase [Spirosoma sp. HMF4905]|uniref:histidine kinase n=1 Tax=Spirosoma arboris TaxID=2682092 RepID=A0A7K1SC70_9BACT|nr:ATP-binding protein [Spirosoma arboris]MVM31380.1 histidine kinase [Spirosoma arboris]
MKSRLLFCFLYLTGLVSWGQSVFRIDSLPTDGVVLNKTWKWQLGDNPAWAKPDFDDSRWDTLNPTQGISVLNKLPQEGIGWLRLRLQVAPKLQGQLIRMYLFQAGASEIFLDGRLFLRNGEINSQQRLEKGARSQYFPLLFIGPDSVHTVAVRFAFEKITLTNDAYPFFWMRLLKSEEVETSLKWIKRNIAAQTIFLGVFFIMGILQLLLYVTYISQKSSLYFGLFLLAQCLTHCSIIILRDFESFPIELSVRNVLVLIDVCDSMLIGGVVLSALFYLIGIYHYFNQPKGILFFVTAVLTLSAFPLYFIASNHLALLKYIVAQHVLGCLVPWAVILRVGIIAIKHKKQGAKLFTWAHSMLLLVFIVNFIIDAVVPNLFPSFSLPVDGHIFFFLAFLSLALTVTLLLSQERADANKLLKKQLGELEVLSQKTIAQEQEKQQLLATQNERLEQQVEARTAELKASQAQLIQKEKLASLGELTAGIAHEIQNPLNFVNNFSEISTELVSELQEEEAKTDRDAELIQDLLNDLSSNLQKINHHGGRASNIVKGMLEHSRTESGEKRPTDLNALTEEYLKIAYHGMRAKDKTGFNCELVTDFDPDLGLAEVAPQEIGRVLLNLYNNAFYAVQARQQQAGVSDYQPIVSVRTRLTPHPPEGGRGVNQVEIRVRDNGTGIPDSVKAKIFQPFFTTKPTGEGTGLGLSLSYDIVTKGHGGSLTVESQPDQGSQFTILLPLAIHQEIIT